MSVSATCPEQEKEKHEDVHGDGRLRSRNSFEDDQAEEDAFNQYPPHVTRHPPERLTSLIPPANFGAVDDHHIFRSSFPLPENFQFLRGLKLNTILTLVPEPFPPEYIAFMKEADIRQIVVALPANKERIKVEDGSVNEALAVVMDRRNHPLLIHCNKGKHRTGCLVGSFRKVQGESLPEVLAEYHAYADPKARLLDEAFLRQFDEQGVLEFARENGYATDEEGNVKNWHSKCKGQKDTNGGGGEHATGMGISGAAIAAITSTVIASVTAVASAAGYTVQA